MYRYVLGKEVLEVDDYPSCNFIVRRDIFEKLDGFDSTFYPGEDTKLCLDITKKLGKRIIYDPAVVVQHHRRKLGPLHFKQVANYALHRGYFAKKYPETSLRVGYFVPTLLVIGFIVGAGLSIFNETIRMLYVSLWVVYLAIISVNVVYGLSRDKLIGRAMKWKLFLLVLFGIIGTHIYYGVFLVKGLLSKKLKEE